VKEGGSEDGVRLALLSLLKGSFGFWVFSFGLWEKTVLGSDPQMNVDIFI